jgi:hypothetical protein
MKLNLNYSVIQSIHTGTGSKKPKFMKLIRKSMDDNNPETFYLYVSIGGKILVHALEYSQLIENKDRIKEYAESHLKTGGSAFSAPLFNQDLLKKLTATHPLSEPRIHELEEV